MADFCKQCSIEIFGEDFGDLANLLDTEDYKTGKTFAVTFCEGCDGTQFFHDGSCIDPFCNKHGEEEFLPIRQIKDIKIKQAAIYIYQNMMTPITVERAVELAKEYPDWEEENNERT